MCSAHHTRDHRDSLLFSSVVDLSIENTVDFTALFPQARPTYGHALGQRSGQLRAAKCPHQRRCIRLFRTLIYKRHDANRSVDTGKEQSIIVYTETPKTLKNLLTARFCTNLNKGRIIARPRLLSSLTIAALGGVRVGTFCACRKPCCVITSH